MFAALRAFGWLDAQPAASDLVFSLPSPLARLGIAIDSALSNLNRAPAGIDLERSLACSPAQLRTERVAAQLGYSSPTSFCHAFANAALPSPGNVRRVVDALP